MIVGWQLRGAVVVLVFAALMLLARCGPAGL